MKTLKIIGIVLLIALLGIQFVPTKRNYSNTVPKTDFMVVNDVPLSVEESIKMSCYDCHSNTTHYPWYNKVQPVAWFLENHIEEGKSELNFNTWSTLSDRRKKSKLRSIINQIKDGDMPLDSYTWIHKDAILSKNKKSDVIGYMIRLKDNLD